MSFFVLPGKEMYIIQAEINVTRFKQTLPDYNLNNIIQKMVSFVSIAFTFSTYDAWSIFNIKLKMYGEIFSRVIEMRNNINIADYYVLKNNIANIANEINLWFVGLIINTYRIFLQMKRYSNQKNKFLKSESLRTKQKTLSYNYTFIYLK